VKNGLHIYKFWEWRNQTTTTSEFQKLNYINSSLWGKDKAEPLQAWSGPEVSRKLRFPNSMTTTQDGGKVISLKHRPHLPPGNTPGTHFC